MATFKEIYGVEYLSPSDNISLVKILKGGLSSTDKILVKYGYLTSDGERTEKYENELRDIVFKKLIDAEDTPEFRKELASALRAGVSIDEE